MLANRRPCITYDIEWNGDRQHVSVGIDPATGEVCEVWAYGPKVGSDGYWLLQETCWNFSHRLQDGETPADLAERTMRYDDGAPTSMRGVLVDAMLTAEADLGA